MFGTLVPRREKFLAPTTDRFARMIGRMEDEMEDLFKRFDGENGGWLTLPTYFVPTADIIETDNEFEITVDLPGMKPEEVHVEMKDGDLWITGKRDEEKEEKGKTYHRTERRHGEFRRVLRLPGEIDPDKVSAKCDNGVLKVSVPKKEVAKAKHIEVKA
jgi:HSP20 family protein